MTDFSKIKIHCSSLGYLFVEPRDKGAKDRGELSETSKSYLYKVYIEHHWNRRRQLTTKQLEKGIICEPKAIEMISVLDDAFYEKNDEVKENEWIIGTADVVDEFIQDVKSSYDAETFIPMILDPLEKNYTYQMQGYMWLWDKQKALVRRCLISAPERILANEKRSLLYRMDVATDENPEYKLASAELEYNLTYEDIPIEEKCITHVVERDENIIKQIPAKVEKAREFLKYLHEKHLALNKKIKLII
jgi:hypothetical protein